MNLHKVKESKDKLVNTVKTIKSLLNKDMDGFLTNYISSANGLDNNFEKVVHLMILRQDLIDKQCNEKVFSGELHDKYHEIIKNLDTEINNFFYTFKTTTNRFSSFVNVCIPHKIRRFIKAKSFSSLINSTIKCTKEDLIELKRVLLDGGIEIKERINRYRDKNIEHLGTPGREGIVANSDKLNKFIIKQNKDEAKKDNEKQQTSKETDECVLKITLDTGDYMYYVHMRAKEIKRGDYIEKGETIGYCDDCGSGHFDKHGSHNHMFTSPKLKINPEDYLLANEYIEESPDIILSYIFVLNYFNNVLSFIRNKYLIPR